MGTVATRPTTPQLDWHTNVQNQMDSAPAMNKSNLCICLWQMQYTSEYHTFKYVAVSYPPLRSQYLSPCPSPCQIQQEAVMLHLHHPISAWRFSCLAPRILLL